MSDQYLILSTQALLASLTDNERTRMMEMGGAILPKHLPKDMPFERIYLQALWDIHKDAGIPSRESLIMRIGLKHPEMEDLAQQVDQIISMKPEHTNISSIAVPLIDRMNAEIVSSGLEQAIKKMNTPIGLASERWQEVMNNINHELIAARRGQMVTQIQAFDMYLESLERMYARTQSGFSVGAVMPYASVQEYISGFMPGEMCLITGKEGRGKSTFAADIAEKNAYNHNVPVLYLPYETSMVRFQQRAVAKHLGIPIKYQMSGQMNPKADPWQSLFSERRETVMQLERDMAPLLWQPCAKWSISEIENTIYIFSEMCKTWGKPGLVVVDYLQKMPNFPYMDKRESYGENAEALKSAAEINEVSLILLSQESENAADGQSRSYGSQEPKQKAQMHLSIVRTEAENDKIRKNKLDYFGEQRYWHRAGDWDSLTTLSIQKGNMDRKGEPAVYVENAHFDVVSATKA